MEIKLRYFWVFYNNIKIITCTNQKVKFAYLADNSNKFTTFLLTILDII